VNYFINRLEANPFSAQTGVSPAVLRSAAGKTHAWAELALEIRTLRIRPDV
jgi:hypothetical protein